MPKLKAVLIISLLSVFVLSLTGCEMLLSRSAETEDEIAGSEAGLPEWLQLSHRSNRDLLAEQNDEPVLPKNEEEDEEDVEVAEPEPAPAEQPVSQPAPVSAPVESSAPAEEEKVENGGLSRSQQMLIDSWNRQREQKDDEKENEEDNFWWDPGTDDSDDDSNNGFFN